MRREIELELVIVILSYISRNWLLIFVCLLLFMWVYCWWKKFHWGAILVSNGIAIWTNVFVHFGFRNTYGRDFSGQTFVSTLRWSEDSEFFVAFSCDSVTLWFSSLVFFVNFVALLSASVFFNQSKKSSNIQFHLIFLSALIALPMFSMTNLLFFYIFFEATIIPVYFFIRLHGSRIKRRSHAANLYLIFSLSGSVLLIAGLLLLLNMCGTFELSNLVLFNHDSQIFSHIAAILIFLGFVIKVPLFPFHIWLPEAHVEAPTPGSILLAGYLLKLGAFGLFKFVIPIFSSVVELYRSYIFVLCCIGVVYISVIALRQFDLKKIIAYSSIIHMAITVMGLCTLKPSATLGALTFMISHGVVATMMFACVGILYARYRSKNLKDYGGLAQIMPVFSFFFFISCISNFSFPGTSNFVGEALIIVSITQEEVFASFVLVVSSIFLSVYSLWMFGRLIFGSLQRESKLTLVIDLVKPEYYMLGICVVAVILLGFCPSFFFNDIENTVLTQYTWIFRDGEGIEAAKGGICGFYILFYLCNSKFILWHIFFFIVYGFLEILSLVGFYDVFVHHTMFGFLFEYYIDTLYAKISHDFDIMLQNFLWLWSSDEFCGWLYRVFPAFLIVSSKSSSKCFVEKKQNKKRCNFWLKNHIRKRTKLRKN